MTRCIETEIGVGTVGVWSDIEAAFARLDPFQFQGAPCFEPPATDEDHAFLFGPDPEESYQP